MCSAPSLEKSYTHLFSKIRPNFFKSCHIFPSTAISSKISLLVESPNQNSGHAMAQVNCVYRKMSTQIRNLQIYILRSYSIRLGEEDKRPLLAVAPARSFRGESRSKRGWLINGSREGRRGSPRTEKVSQVFTKNHSNFQYLSKIFLFANFFKICYFSKNFQIFPG